MNDIRKGAATLKGLVAAEELPLVNAQALRELAEDEVFLFRIAAADDRVDRDCERFTAETLKELAALFIGKTVIMDHNWTAKNQTARIYAGDVEEADGVSRMILRAYMLKTEETAEAIRAIEGGILREVSVGCAIKESRCSICGELYGSCPHRKGNEYDGEICHATLHGAVDAYELSFVAVPAQREAGIVKGYKGDGGDDNTEFLQRQAEALQLQEEKRI